MEHSMRGIFCANILKKYFDPQTLLEFAEKKFVIDEQNLNDDYGSIICFTTCMKAKFIINYENFTEKTHFGISLNRFSGDGFIAATTMKKFLIEIKDLFSSLRN